MSKKHTNDTRIDLAQIVGMIEKNSRVLDIGCGDGDLLAYLKKKKNIHAYGIEISEEKIIECVSKGLTVFQGNIDQGLSDYSDNSFDYAILSQTLQVVNKPELVINEILRVSKKAIVSFPNFGYWSCRLQIALGGRMPISNALPDEWYNTPNIRYLTIQDFRDFCRERNIRILREIDLRIFPNQAGRLVGFMPNLLAHHGIFLISKS